MGFLVDHTLDARTGGILNDSRMVGLRPLSVFVVVLIISACVLSMRADSNKSVGFPRVMIMTERPHEPAAEGPLLLSAVKAAFRLSTALFARASSHADTRKRIGITSGIRN